MRHYDQCNRFSIRPIKKEFEKYLIGEVFK